MDAKPYKIPHPFRKLTKKLIDIIVKDIKEGSTHTLAAESNGITIRILQIWAKQGKIDVEHEKDTLCAYLVRVLANVKKTEVKGCRESIYKREKGHKGAEWTLEHAYARDFSQNASVQELAQEIDELRSMIIGDAHDEEKLDSESSEK